jgi:hypothetical protein
MFKDSGNAVHIDQIDQKNSETQETTTHDRFAAEAGLFGPDASKNQVAKIEVRTAPSSEKEEKEADSPAKPESKEADEKPGDDDDVFVQDTIKFPEGHKEKLAALIDAEKVMPMLSPIMENQMDDVMADADQNGEEVRQRLSDDLEHFDGQEKLDRADKASKDFSTLFYGIDNKAHRQAIYNYMTSGAARVAPKELAEYPKLKTAMDEWSSSQKDPDFKKAAEIRTEAYDKLEAIAALKETYAKHLSETERSGKALVMIVQAKEIRREINRRIEK